jgi:hypothetical protein
MATFSMEKLVVTVLAVLSLLLVADLAVERLASGRSKAGRTEGHKLPATLETTQWDGLILTNLPSSRWTRGIFHDRDHDAFP